MTKLDYYNEWMKQVVYYLKLPEDTSILTLREKCENEEQYKKAVFYRAVYNGKSYSAYLVELNGKNSIMLCLHYDSAYECRDENDNIKHYETVKIDAAFDLLDISFLAYFEADKIDFSGVKYIVANRTWSDGVRDYDNMADVKYVIANELRLGHFVNYNYKKRQLEVSCFKSIRCEEHNVYDNKKTFFTLFSSAECEIGNMQYVDKKEVLSNRLKKYRTSMNTLRNGDIGYKEFGAWNKTIVYSISNTYIKGMKIHASYRDFFDEDAFQYACHINAVEAKVYFSFASYEDFKNSKGVYHELQTFINGKKLVDSIDEYEKMLNRAYSLFALKYGNELEIYSLSDDKDIVEVFRYTYVSDVDIKVNELFGVVSHVKAA